jgi:hypothetical protein
VASLDLLARPTSELSLPETDQLFNLSAKLLLDSFDEADFGRSRIDPGQLKSGLVVKAALFFGGSFDAAGDDKHLQVEQLAETRFISLRYDRFHQQKPPRSTHCSAWPMPPGREEG